MDRVSDASIAAPAVGAPKVSFWRVVAAGLMVAVGVCFLVFAMSSNAALSRDFCEYWAVGHQLIHHGNPYDGAATLRILNAAGWKGTPETHQILRNPPFALFMTLPLGFVNVRIGIILWSLAVTAALMASLRMIWIMHGRPPDRLHLVGYMFGPALACLLAGQLGIFLLFGVTLFLYLQGSRPYLAGAALLLCSMKPHLFLPFGVAMIAWMVVRKDYRVLIGACAAVLTSTALIVFLDPGIWSQYAHGERGEKIQNLFIPCMSVLFRVVIDRNAIWLQFLPAFAGCVWGVWYFLTRRDRWNWIEHGSMLLVVSILVAPYAWFTDEAIVLPAILAGLYGMSNAGRSLLSFGFIAGAALIEVLAWVPLSSGYYMWTAPAWFAWYLYAIRASGPVEAMAVPSGVRNEQVTNPPRQLNAEEAPVEAK